MKGRVVPVQTIDEYMAGFPKEVQALLEKVRQTIRAAAPDAIEAISYRIPTFKQDGRYLIYFAGYKTHIGLYPVEVDDTQLGVQLAPYAAGKATLKFLLDRPIPFDLISKVVRVKVRQRSV